VCWDNNIIPINTDLASQLPDLFPSNLTLDASTKGDKEENKGLNWKRDSCTLRGEFLESQETSIMADVINQIPRACGVQSGE
jgi:hypothetical protein